MNTTYMKWVTAVLHLVFFSHKWFSNNAGKINVKNESYNTFLMSIFKLNSYKCLGGIEI